MKYLLVGGEFDSQMMEIQNIDGKAPLDLETFEGDYKRVVMAFSGESLTFYAHESLSPVEAINMLIAAYTEVD